MKKQSYVVISAVKEPSAIAATMAIEHFYSDHEAIQWFQEEYSKTTGTPEDKALCRDGKFLCTRRTITKTITGYEFT